MILWRAEGVLTEQRARRREAVSALSVSVGSGRPEDSERQSFPASVSMLNVQEAGEAHMLLLLNSKAGPTDIYILSSHARLLYSRDAN